VLSLGAAVAALWQLSSTSSAEEQKEQQPQEADLAYVIPERQDLPLFSMEEIAQHRAKHERIWVTYQHGVYDITEWVDIHPGGNVKIMLAAGAPIPTP